MRHDRAMDEGTRTLVAVGALIEKIRRAGITAPVRGPEFRSLAEIAAAADAAGERVIVLGAQGSFELPGRVAVHPMAARGRTGTD